MGGFTGKSGRLRGKTGETLKDLSYPGQNNLRLQFVVEVLGEPWDFAIFPVLFFHEVVLEGCLFLSPNGKVGRGFF